MDSEPFSSPRSNGVDIQGDRLQTSNGIDIQGDRLLTSNGVDSQGDRLLTSKPLTSNKGAHGRGACPPVSEGVECYSQGAYPLTFIKGAVNQNECQSLVSSGHGGEQSPDNTKEEDTSVDSKSEAATLRDEGADEEEGDQVSQLFAGLPSRDLDSLTQGDAVTYDDVLGLLGEFGRYQKLICLLLCIPAISGGIQILLAVFTLAVPDHRCAVPGLDNDTWRVQGVQHAMLINASIPRGHHQPASYSSCTRYTIISNPRLSENGGGWTAGDWTGGNSSQYYNGTAQGRNGSSGTEGCGRYVYDESVYTATISTELDLVCGRSLYRSHAQMMVMLGSLVGSQLFGLLADVWGRRVATMISIAVHVTSSFALTWVTNYVMLMTFMFPLGASVSGIICPTFVLGMEFVGPSKRVLPGYGIMGFWAVGVMLVAPLAYWLRDWQQLQLASSLFALPLLSFWWLVPESPRWLVSKGRVSEAEVIVARAARINKVTLPAGLLEKVYIPEESRMPLWKACSCPKLFFRHLIIFFAWTVCSLTYYGLSWNVGTLAGSVHVNIALSGVMEIVSFAICILLLDRIGRRALCCGLFVLSGVTCTGTVFPVLFAPPSLQWTGVALAMMGKLGIAGAFATLYIFSSEIFPTVVRNSGIGASSLCARVGGILAPYIANMGQSLEGEAAPAVPLVIFGVTSVIAGVLLCFLPETLKRRLPETIEEAMNMGREHDKQEPVKP